MAKISRATSKQSGSLQALASAMEKLEDIKHDNLLLLEKNARISAVIGQQKEHLKQAIAIFSAPSQELTP